MLYRHRILNFNYAPIDPLKNQSIARVYYYRLDVVEILPADDDTEHDPQVDLVHYFVFLHRSASDVSELTNLLDHSLLTRHCNY